MIGIDTNVLVRYLAQDDSVQSAKATRFVEEEISAARPGFVTSVVLCEVAWVLARAYGVARADLAQVLERILRVEALTHEHIEAALLALEDFSVSRLDFADCLIAHVCRRAGCREVVTFDADFARRADVRRLI